MKTKLDWDRLQNPSVGKYSLIKHGDSNLYFSKNSKGKFGLLISDILQKPSIKYENIETKIYSTFSSTNQTLTDCIIFQNKESVTNKSFCDAITSQLNQIKQKDFFVLKDIEHIFNEINKITKKNNEQLNEIIGVWGELYLINEILDKLNSEPLKKEIINSWESHESRTTIDFNIIQKKILIEVKTTIKELRHHHINSIDQITCDSSWEGFLASICISINESGISCIDLVNKIKSKLDQKTRIIFDGLLNVRGISICNDEQYKFIINPNKKLEFFTFSSIPKPSFNDNIININWDIILDEINYLSQSEKNKILNLTYEV